MDSDNDVLVYPHAIMQSIFENIIFIELLYRGYDVRIGKFDEYEVDFIAQKSSERLYIQVC